MLKISVQTGCLDSSCIDFRIQKSSADARGGKEQKNVTATSKDFTTESVRRLFFNQPSAPCACDLLAIHCVSQRRMETQRGHGLQHPGSSVQPALQVDQQNLNIHTQEDGDIIISFALKPDLKQICSPYIGQVQNAEST